MWIKTKDGNYANFETIACIVYNKTNKEWQICENGDGFVFFIDDDTAKRLIDKITQNLI